MGTRPFGRRLVAGKRQHARLGQHRTVNLPSRAGVKEQSTSKSHHGKRAKLHPLASTAIESSKGFATVPEEGKGLAAAPPEPDTVAMRAFPSGFVSQGLA